MNPLTAIARGLFFIYLTFILVPILLPLKYGWRFFRRPSGDQNSYFQNVHAGTDTIIPFEETGRLRIYSFQTRIARFLLLPILKIAPKLPGDIFVHPNAPLRPTPQNVGSLVSMQLKQNILLSQKAAESLGADYLFALQPTLMDGQHQAMTDYDKNAYRARSEKRIWHFPQTAFMGAYYRLIRSDFKKENQIRFCDISTLFHLQPEQRFVDTCHWGNIGQKEIGETLAEEIWQQETGKRDQQ